MARSAKFRSVSFLPPGLAVLWLAGAVTVGCGDSEATSNDTRDETDSEFATTTGFESTSTTSPGTSTSTTGTTTGGEGCPGGTPILCGDSCVDTNSNPLHCGGCNNTCDGGEVCSNGTCALSCGIGTTNCAGACVDTASNPLYCGNCNTSCEDGEVCSAGNCGVTCGGGTTNCDGACVDTTSNPLYCGGCDTSCGGGSGWACVAEGCVDIRAWDGPVLVEADDTSNAEAPQVAMDSTGNAVAVWRQNDGSRYNIWANLYDAAGNSWGTEVLIETDDVGNAELPQVGVDDNGYAVAVWRQVDGTRFNIWANRYDVAGAAWGTAELIETDDAGNADAPQVAVDGSGNAVAVWRQTDGSRFNIWANRYDAGDDAWGTAELIEVDDAGNADAPQVGVDDAGNAVAVWRQTDGARFNIVANHYTAAGDAWGTAGVIESDDVGNADEPQVAVHGSGDAVVVWRQTDGSRFNAWANHYDAAAGTWGTAGIIESEDLGNAEAPQVTLDPGGNAVAVWRQTDGSRYNIWSNRYDAAGGTWGTAVLIESSNVGNANAPQVGIDADGNAVAVWHQTDGLRFNVWSNRYYAAGGAWGTAEIIESDNSGNAETPQVAVDDVGRAVAVWRQTDGLRFSIWANRLQ